MLIDRASDTDGFQARFQEGAVRLTWEGSLRDGSIDVTVRDAAGTMLSHVKVPASGPLAFREAVTAGANEVSSAASALAADPAALEATLWAYQHALAGIDSQLPFDALSPKFRTAVMTQLTVFIDAVTPNHDHPQVMAFAATANPKENYDEYGDFLYPCQGCANNDEGSEYSTATAQCYHNPGGTCAGACGPGCGWCNGAGGLCGAGQCFTAPGCQWHDANCGSYSHFFDCVDYGWTGGNNCIDYPQQIGCSGS